METIVDGSVTELTTAELEQRAAVRRTALWIFNDVKNRNNSAGEFNAGQDEHLIALTDEVLDLEARVSERRAAEAAAERGPAAEPSTPQTEPVVPRAEPVVPAESSVPEAEPAGHARPITASAWILAGSAALVPLVGQVIGRVHAWGLGGLFVAFAVAAGLVMIHRRAGQRGYRIRRGAAVAAAVAGVGLAVVALGPFLTWACAIPLTVMGAALVASLVAWRAER